MLLTRVIACRYNHDMPTMFEIYENYAPQYHQLVSAEDYEGNLPRLLHAIADWRGARVLEAGVGTGRVTRMYVENAARATCCDSSVHMLEHARGELSAYGDKIEWKAADNFDLPTLEHPVDLFIEGWSFGHGIFSDEGHESVDPLADRLVENAVKNVRSGGLAIIIETLGTNSRTPNPPHEFLATFYEHIESVHGFSRHEISTDYRFDTVDAAARIMGFFFGPTMDEEIRRDDLQIVPEWTGVWVRQC